MGEVGCYTLDLYCDNEDEELTLPGKAHVQGHPGFYKYFAWQFIGETAAQCRRVARRTGWTWKLDGQVLCPICSGKKTLEQCQELLNKVGRPHGL